MNQIKLTSAEISSLWASYLYDCMGICVMTHFLETVEDGELKGIIQETLQIAQNHKDTILDIFKTEDIAVPIGFEAEKHVVPNAPKLFSDIFNLQYSLEMARFGIVSHTTGFTISARADIRQLFNDFMGHTSELYQHVVDCMQSKGVLPPLNLHFLIN